MREITASPSYLSNIKDRTQKARSSKAHASSLGQWIGAIVSDGTTQIWEEILCERKDFKLKKPEAGKSRTYLSNTRGQEKEIDDIICDSSGRPIIISESKWLKDARHLNDKGAWVALMSEVKQQNISVKGAVSILAGPWDAGGNTDALNHVVQVVLIKTDDVYDLLSHHGIEIRIDHERNMYDHPEIPLNKYMDLIDEYADRKVNFVSSLGYELVRKSKSAMIIAFDKIISLPDNMDLVDNKDIEEIAITYKTKQGFEFRELFSNITTANASISKRLIK